MEQLVQTMTAGAISVLAVLVGAVFSYLREYLTAKTRATKLSMKSEQFQTIVNVSDTAVRFVEQTFKDIKGEEKLNAALDFVVQELQKLNIKMTKTELLPIVESAVHGLQTTYLSVVDELTKKQEHEVNIQEHEIDIEE